MRLRVIGDTRQAPSVLVRVAARVTLAVATPAPHIILAAGVVAPSSASEGTRVVLVGRIVGGGSRSVTAYVHRGRWSARLWLPPGAWRLAATVGAAYERDGGSSVPVTVRVR
jgi:hypothetical protein